MKAQLILENGVRFNGSLFGAKKDIVGEVVFSTGMIGYQETLTDPSLAGQILTMTFPLMGNCGINLEDNEAKHTSLKGLVVREKADHPSNFRYEMDLDAFLKEQGVVGIEGIDTRALTRMIREHGTMTAVIMKGEPSDEEVKAFMATLDNKGLINEVTTKEKYVVNPEGKTEVAYIDLGTKMSIINNLAKRDCKVTVFPASVTAAEIEALNPDLVFVSSGPGDPMDAPYVVETVKALVGKYPISGICLGHLIVSLALGCKTKKMKFGHHGGHPVKDLSTGKVYITSQGHNYVVDECPDDVEVAFVSVNDGTCEGIKHKSLPIQSFQFHPEGAPGAQETQHIFDRILKEVK